MKVEEIHEPTVFWKAFVARRTIPAPIRLMRVKLKHDGENHYLYVIEFGCREAYIHDSATDFSGTGGRYKEEMDRIFKVLAEMFQAKVEEYEIPYELYWKLKNVLYFLYKK